MNLAEPNYYTDSRTKTNVVAVCNTHCKISYCVTTHNCRKLHISCVAMKDKAAFPFQYHVL